MDLIRCELRDGVGMITLNRPDRHNAMNDAMAAEWERAVDWAYRAGEVRCVVVRGEGRSFCSGRDTSELGVRVGGETHEQFVRRVQDVRFRLGEMPKPVIAALKGHVVGGGFEIALRADLRIAASDAVMSLPEVRYGLVPDTGGTQLLSVYMGPSRAKYLAWTGDVLTAAEAERYGIVHSVVQPAELDDAVSALATRLACLPVNAVAFVKQLVDQSWADETRRGTRAELLAQSALLAQRQSSAGTEAAPPRNI